MQRFRAFEQYRSTASGRNDLNGGVQQLAKMSAQVGGMNAHYAQRLNEKRGLYRLRFCRPLQFQRIDIDGPAYAPRVLGRQYRSPLGEKALQVRARPCLRKQMATMMTGYL